MNLLADTIRWSPPSYNGNQWLGKEELREGLKGNHDGFENISYSEGIVLPNQTETGFWSGSVFPQDQATSTPANIRIYGTWSATHSETGKEVHAKWFSLMAFNEDGKIISISEYYDTGGIAAQIAGD